jgi:hypothetical protein
VRLVGALAVVALALLAGCASHTASLPPADVPPAERAEGAEPPDPNIRPLTLEQEEAVAKD